jgi:hypothetical protein
MFVGCLVRMTRCSIILRPIVINRADSGVDLETSFKPVPFLKVPGDRRCLQTPRNPSPGIALTGIPSREGSRYWKVRLLYPEPHAEKWLRQASWGNSIFHSLADIIDLCRRVFLPPTPTVTANGKSNLLSCVTRTEPH